ncbi:DUF1127 domain-containing protein [Thalassorhabdomicrobium marinisediminis]|uniref:YjiS-like domain-containing protein n=1 Tax=Thalassorhabdomicrobium marinisediminis TaxID=2170577 RepID=A0A2T7FXG5_9RHOB|nr:DUF1127 domain-containing protein [Thalassorhabdomicrobium marinisediminis]PVA06862.1 hypothetical protein DC363_06820 [Thalassorhabdomicrobium marinisediminis]
MSHTVSPPVTRRRIGRLTPSLATYLAVWKQRRVLADLDDDRLRDLGLTPAQAAREAARPFWDLS